MIWKMHACFIFAFEFVSLFWQDVRNLVEFNANFSFIFYIIQHVLQDNIYSLKWMGTFPANIYLLKVNNKDTRKGCNNKNTRTTSRRSVVFIVNFEHISHLFLVFLLLTLHK